LCKNNATLKKNYKEACSTIDARTKEMTILENKFKDTDTSLKNLSNKCISVTIERDSLLDQLNILRNDALNPNEKAAESLEIQKNENYQLKGHNEGLQKSIQDKDKVLADAEKEIDSLQCEMIAIHDRAENLAKEKTVENNIISRIKNDKSKEDDDLKTAIRMHCYLDKTLMLKELKTVKKD
jgi:chromosome segregation ATPase